MVTNQPEHLVKVLTAIRNINRIIVKEKNASNLIKKVCHSLVESREYESAWIFLMDRQEKCLNVAEAGLSEKFSALRGLLFKCDYTPCNRIVLDTKQLLTVSGNKDFCSECKLPEKCENTTRIIVPIIYQDIVFGVLNISFSNTGKIEDEEREMISEVAEDLGFALYSIEMEKLKKVADLKVEEEQFLMNALMDNLPDSVYFKNEKSEFIRVNKSMLQNFGAKSKEDVAGKTDFDFFDEEHAVCAYRDEQKIINTLQPIINLEEKETWPDGRITWVSTTKMPMINDTGKVIGTFGISRDITQEKEIEESLRNNREMFEKIGLGSLDAIIIINSSGAIVFWNPAAEKMFGYSAKYAKGKDVHQLLMPERYRGVLVGGWEKIDQMGNENQVGKVLELSVKKSNGEEFPVEMALSVLNINYQHWTLANVRDITERKKAERLFKERDLILQKMTENVPGMIFQFVLNPDGSRKFPYCSDGIQSVFGVDAVKVKEDGAVLFDFVHKQDLDGLNASILQSAQDLSVWQKQFRLYDRNNTLKWIKGEARPQKFKNGTVEWYGYIYDVTELVRSQKTLENEYQRTRAIMNSVQSGIIMVRKKDRVIVDANPAVEKILGISAKDYISFICNKYICPSQVGQCPIIDKGMELTNVECFARNAKNELIPIIKNVSEIELDGEMYFIESFVDISKQKETEKQLLAAKEDADMANKAKSEFLANMSHEIRTPMNSILGFSEVLLNKVNDEKHRSYLRTILSSGQTLLALLNDILDLSKIEAGRLDVDFQPVNLYELVNEVVQLFDQKKKEKNINLIVDIEKGFPSVVTLDEIRIRQVLLNIIGNAVKFTSKGYVKIELKVVKQYTDTIDFSIAVTDTGVGISKEYLGNIFESFSQESSDSTRHFEGTGLGLAISKKLCELMNGTITVESEPGKGSVFCIWLKNVSFSENSLEKEEDFTWNKQKVSFESAKILIVDDVEFNRELVESYLEEFQFELYDAENGKEAVRIAKNQKPDLILMDIKMPVMDGYEATSLIRRDSETCDCPVIALTASTMQPEDQRILKRFDGYIRKPVQRAPLIKELMRFIKHKIDTESNKKGNREELQVEKSSEIGNEVKVDFNARFEERLLESEKSMIVDEFEDFTKELQDFAEEYKIKYLGYKVESLQRLIDEFEFTEIISLLREIRLFFKIS